MTPCGQQAFLIVTRSIEGTSTSVARRRVELRCALALEHPGPHHDPKHNEKWEGRAGERQTLLQHEEDDGTVER